MTQWHNVICPEFDCTITHQCDAIWQVTVKFLMGALPTSKLFDQTVSELKISCNP